MTANTDQRPGGCLAAFLNLFRQAQPTAEQTSDEPLPYRLRADFLSPAELSFYHVLTSVVGDQAVITMKVRLADLFFVPKSQEQQAHQNKINSKHLDFLLCDSKTMRPMMGIELDDKSHERQNRVERDAFVDRVFQAAGLPLLHIVRQQAYNAREIGDQLNPLLKGGSVVPAQSPQPVFLASTSPICPTCNIPMVIRTSTRGPNQGNQFYGCINYPRCRSTVPIAEK